MKTAMVIALLIFVIIGGIILNKASNQVVEKLQDSDNYKMLEKLKLED